MSIGYVTDETTAKQFCSDHDDCIYQEIKTSNVNDLENNLIVNMSEVELIRVPFKKLEI